MWLAGGSYDFHFSLATVIYEFRKDVVTCLLIGGALWLIDSRREAQRARAATPAEPGTATRIPSGSAMAQRASASSRAKSSGSVRPEIMSSTASPTAAVIWCGERWRRPRRELARFNLARVHRTRLANLDRVNAVELKPSGDFELTFDTGQTVAGQPALPGCDRFVGAQRCWRQAEWQPDRRRFSIFLNCLSGHRDRGDSPARCTKSLLFAPRLMLEPGPQSSPSAVRASSNDAGTLSMSHFVSGHAVKSAQAVDCQGSR